MRTFAIAAFFAGLLLAVAVMFFGVRKQLAEERLAHRRWPLALAAMLSVGGALGYLLGGDEVTTPTLALVLLSALAAAAAAWWLVQRSAAIPSTDPEDDPRYRFQGHVARIVEPIGSPGSEDGRIVFEFDGRRHEFQARWSSSGDWKPSANEGATSGQPGSEVVIEIVEGDVAFVEPWRVVEERL